MATKKVNVRKDYSYKAKKSPPAYKPAGIPRKPQFLILRGPGLDPRAVIEENIRLREFSERKKIKLKFLLGAKEDEIVKMIKDANTWASGIVINIGSLLDESEKIQKAITKILISTEEVREEASYEEALLRLLDADK